MIHNYKKVMNLFNYQKEHPLLVEEETIEDLQEIVSNFGGDAVLNVGDILFKFFIEKDDIKKLYYISGDGNLRLAIAKLMKQSSNVDYNAGVPIFKE